MFGAKSLDNFNLFVELQLVLINKSVYHLEIAIFGNNPAIAKRLPGLKETRKCWSECLSR
jgi:hypothetical protein